MSNEAKINSRRKSLTNSVDAPQPEPLSSFTSIAGGSSSVTHRLADFGRSMLMRFSSMPQNSQFIEKGTLTPDEFLEAGDLLAFKFPTWQWEGAVGKRVNSWLPPDRQFLITRNVACYKRVRDIEHRLSSDVRVDADGGWVLPVDDPSENEPAAPMCTITSTGVKENAHTRSVSPDPNTAGGFGQRTTPDMRGFADVDCLVTDDDDAAALDPVSYFVRNAPDGDIVSTRTYDLSITYDKFFQTPRLWLFGYNENGIPLTPNEIFEDILTDYAAKTVTIDPHPCTGIPTASIHPCRHAQVMKKVVDHWRSQGIKPRHDLALIVLLKFIACVIPTIDYDFTMDIDMGLC